MKIRPFGRKKRVVYISSRAHGDAEQLNKQNSQKIQELENTLSELKKPTFDPTEHLDKSRSKIAFIFVICYFAIITVTLAGIPMYDKWINQPVQLDLGKTLDQFGTLLGTPLGFVVGYYFKENKKK